MWEALMGARPPKSPLPLTVRPMFEPTRIAAACLRDAYERVVPLPRRSLEPNRPDSEALPASLRSLLERKVS
jgi:hypothetical protein